MYPPEIIFKTEDATSLFQNVRRADTSMDDDDSIPPKKNYSYLRNQNAYFFEISKVGMHLIGGGAIFISLSPPRIEEVNFAAK